MQKSWRLETLLIIAFILMVGPVEAWAQFSLATCRKPDATILLMQLKTGPRVVFSLTREGDRMRGRAQAWKPSGISAGHGLADGYFGGVAPTGRGFVLTVSWEQAGITSSSFQGYMHQGRGAGTGSSLSGLAPVHLQISTLEKCTGWPEQLFPQVPCKSGYVWREANPNDFACAPPNSRARSRQENQLARKRRDPTGIYGAESCKPSFVWREANPGDTVCVPPEVRKTVRIENRFAGDRRQ